MRARDGFKLGDLLRLELLVEVFEEGETREDGLPELVGETEEKFHVALVLTGDHIIDDLLAELFDYYHAEPVVAVVLRILLSLDVEGPVRNFHEQLLAAVLDDDEAPPLDGLLVDIFTLLDVIFEKVLLVFADAVSFIEVLDYLTVDVEAGLFDDGEFVLDAIIALFVILVDLAELPGSLVVDEVLLLLLQGLDDEVLDANGFFEATALLVFGELLRAVLRGEGVFVVDRDLLGRELGEEVVGSSGEFGLIFGFCEALEGYSLFHLSLRVEESRNLVAFLGV